MAFPEGNNLFAGDFRANLDETNAYHDSIYEEMEMEMVCLTSRILFRKVCSYKMYKMYNVLLFLVQLCME